MMFFLAAAWLAFEVSSRFANFMIAEAIDAVSSGLNPIIFPSDNSLKTAMSETAAFNPQAAASGYANGYTAPNATRNVQSVAIADATGVITVTTTAAAGGGNTGPHTREGVQQTARAGRTGPGGAGFGIDSRHGGGFPAPLRGAQGAGAPGWREGCRPFYLAMAWACCAKPRARS